MGQGEYVKQTDFSKKRPVERWFIKFLWRALLATLAFLLALFVLINALALPQPAIMAAPARNSSLVISGVNVIDARGNGSVAYLQMVVIVGDRISYVGAQGSKRTPPGARVIEAQGKFLIPGLWDSHIHTLRLSPQLHFPLLIANGVTSVRDMGDACSWSSARDCRPETPRWRAQIQSGAMIGPRIIESVSYHLEELPEQEAELRNWIAVLKARGEKFLKIQLDDLASTQDFEKVMRIASANDFKAAGHIPFAVNLADTIYPLVSIEHDASLLPQCSDFAAEFNGKNSAKLALLNDWNSAKCTRVLGQLAARSVAYVPTHIASSGQDAAFAAQATGTNPVEQAARQTDPAPTQRYVIAPQRWIAWLFRAAGQEDAQTQGVLNRLHQAALELTSQARAAGVPVLAGTDALDAGVIHGFSLHQELQYLVAAGLTPAQALFAATAEPARVFGMAGSLGVIEAGKVADLVLLEANPLIDIRNTQRIRLVVSDGRVYADIERAKALEFVAQQSRSIRVICRFLRGIWFDG